MIERSFGLLVLLFHITIQERHVHGPALTSETGQRRLTHTVPETTIVQGQVAGVGLDDVFTGSTS